MISFEEIKKNKSFSQYEHEILNLWKDIDAFKRSIKSKSSSKYNNYVFYDGPPFATGLPHYGHFVASTIKDIIPRYWSMHGKKIIREFGWDTHGLPIEMEMEKKLKLSGPKSIIKYGVDKFNEACRSSVLKYHKEWEKSLTRLGRWVDFDNDYKTMDLSFMESVWWGFNELWRKKLIYKSFKVMPYSCRLSTTLSNFEANLDYRDIQDPSITVKLNLKNDVDNAKLLIWTTTPWTLPANLAVAISSDIKYVKVVKNNEVFILAKDRVEINLGKNIKILSEIKTDKLIGLKYKPLFPYFRNHKNAFKILQSNHVSIENGTGIVHLAPAYGLDDFNVCKKYHIDVVDPIDEEGVFKESVDDFNGLNIKDAESLILNKLKNQNLILKHDTIQHSYPFCWRSGDPLIYKAVPVWMLAVSKFKLEMINHNSNINWIPKSIGEKRFGNWLKNAQDWNISRSRFWGTPIPLWECKKCNKFTSISSVNELEKQSNINITDLHSHNIDKIILKCSNCGENTKRIKEVFDCWFDAGSMPYAKMHYPFENKKNFINQFPANFIAEGLDQTRGWFYTMLVLSTALFNKAPFKNIIVNGLVLSEDGSKMSKSRKNFPNPNKILEKYSADALRAYLINSPVVRGETLSFSEDGVKDIIKNLMIPIHNSWSFFIQYANIDKWNPEKDSTKLITINDRPEIDQWIISKIESLVMEINLQMKGYHIHKVIPLIIIFIDDLSNWYIRCSRRRFWRNAKNTKEFLDKYSAYSTLYEILNIFSKLLAPFLPFISERIYQNLIVNMKVSKLEKNSVHLCDYPKEEINKINLKLEKDIDIIRKIINMGRSLREQQKIQIRQPLSNITIATQDNNIKNAALKHKKLITSELNIKNINLTDNDESLCTIILKPNFKSLGKRIGKRMDEVNKLISNFNKKELEILRSNKKIKFYDQFISLDDIVITRKAINNIAVISYNNLTIALETKLNEMLIIEGFSRKIINYIQKIRKEKKLLITNKVEISIYFDSKIIYKVFKNFESHIKEEVLAVKINLINNLSCKLESRFNISDNIIIIEINKVS